MSFIARSSIRTASRAAAFQPRAFSTSFVARKSATESVKDSLHKVDKAVASKIVDGIETTQQAAGKVKEVSGIKAGEAKGEAAELSGSAKGKAHELAGEAKGKKEEVKGKL